MVRRGGAGCQWAGWEVVRENVSNCKINGCGSKMEGVLVEDIVLNLKIRRMNRRQLSRTGVQSWRMSEMEEQGSASGAEESEAQFLLRYLQTHDAVCPLCGYNLRRLTVARWPEGGRGVKLAVGMKEPYLRALVTMLVAMCISGGCGLLSFILVVNVVIQI